jgi:hypothetical protein
MHAVLERANGYSKNTELRNAGPGASFHDLVGHRLLDDHFVLRVDCDLRVVADANLRMAAIARLSGSVSDIWLSPVRSSSASIAP